MSRIPNHQSDYAARNPHAVPPVDDAPVVGRWRLVSRISDGPLASLFLARPDHSPPHHPADYVVKMLQPAHVQDRMAIELLRREANLGSQAIHPHLISLLAAHVEDPPYYLVMPRLVGATMRELIARGTPSLVPEMLWYCRQTVAALGALHERGWLHADVKPDNIFISPAGHATLLDLGLARRTGRMRGPDPQPFVGTLNYAAPETFSDTRGVDVRSDIYSLGVTLYEALTGRVPFACESSIEIVEAHRTATPINPRSVNPQIPAGVNRLLSHMLAKDPLRRPASAAECAECLVALEVETIGDYGEM